MNTDLICFEGLGTIIDWKKGIIKVLHPLFEEFLLDFSDEEIWTLFVSVNDEFSKNETKSLKDISYNFLMTISKDLGLNIPEKDYLILYKSFPDWDIFNDVYTVLKNLKSKFKLVLLINIEKEIIIEIIKKAGIEFDSIISSENISLQKENDNLETVFNSFGYPLSNILYVCQASVSNLNRFKNMEISTIGINSYKDKIHPEWDANSFASFGELDEFLLNIK